MADIQLSDAILFPSDGMAIWLTNASSLNQPLFAGRLPTVVSLMTRFVAKIGSVTGIKFTNSYSPVPYSSVPYSSHHGTYGNSAPRIPHPEVHMDYVYLSFLMSNYRTDDELTSRLPKSMDLVHGDTRCITSPSKDLSKFYVTHIYFPPDWQLIESLVGMNKKFSSSYIVFFPTVSRNGMPFPINKCIRDLQGAAFREEMAWRGNIIAGKYTEHPFSSLTNASMADYPIIKNYFMTHGYVPDASCTAASLADAVNFDPNPIDHHAT